MPNLREPAVVGTFYPADPARLAESVDRCVAAAAVYPMTAKAIVAPHAGYVYSGPIAGSSFRAVQHLAGRVARVVLIGPAHRLGFHGIATASVAGFATPLGVVPVDRAAVDDILGGGLVRTLDQAFDQEHALEVLLPFIQRVFGAVQAVPLLVGYDCATELVDRVLERLWGGPETLVVVSSDLSHFLDHPTASRLDGETAAAIERLDPGGLGGDRACGHRALAGLLRRGQVLDLRASTLDLRTSADTAGGPDRVVGYGSFAFEYAASARLPEPLRTRLLAVARDALVGAARHGAAPEVSLAEVPLPLKAVRQTFVTVEVDGRLRGCIGSQKAHQPLIVDVAMNAARAARFDARFPSVTPDESERATLAISILSRPRRIEFETEADLLAGVQPEVEGLVLKRGERQALFLPKVWHDLSAPLLFVRHLKAKAGIDPDYCGSDLEAYRFTAEVIDDRPTS